MHPRPPRRRAVRTTARLLFLSLAPAAASPVWLPPTPAAAHTDLVSGTPAPGASLDAPPPRIGLTFSDAMTERYAKVALTAPDGSSAGQGAPAVAGRTATLTVRPGPGAAGALAVAALGGVALAAAVLAVRPRRSRRAR